MTFSWPWLLATLLAVPLLVLGYTRLVRRRAALAQALAAQGLVTQGLGTQWPGTQRQGTQRQGTQRQGTQRQGSERQGAAGGPRRRSRRRHLPATLLLAALTLLLVGLARPQATVAEPRREGTVVLTFDVSSSMAATDIAPTRIAAAKAAAKTFVAGQPSSIRLGVVSFGDSGVVVQRPTTDRALVLAAIDRLAPQGGTSIGRGIQTSLSAIAGKAVQLDPANGSVEADGQNLGFYGTAAVVMLSDGENTGGPDPVQVAELASTAGVKVYPVGLGSAAGTVLKIDGFQVATALDEPLLQEIAAKTDGKYFNATDAASLQQVYSSINLAWTIEAKPIEVTALFAAAAALLLLVGCGLSVLWYGRVI